MRFTASETQGSDRAGMGLLRIDRQSLEKVVLVLDLFQDMDDRAVLCSAKQTLSPRPAVQNLRQQLGAFRPGKF
ncbi:hypothetical protein EBZ37_11490 [bacterium]|nr:hypothetical protein [bacterium]